jgi:hypothetical protein
MDLSCIGIRKIFLGSLAPPCMVHGPAALSSPESLLEMAIFMKE